MPARRVQTDRRGRFYELEDGARYPSVTNILDIVGKPALITWAANQERDLVMRAAAQLYEDVPLSPKMSRIAYMNSLKTRLGAQRAHEKVLVRAGEIGSEAHALIEWNLRNELGQKQGPQPQIGDKASLAFAAYERWRAQIGLRPLMVEQTLWSRTHKYAGTMDLCADVKELGALAVIDWKTGKAIYEESLLQNAAYVQALTEMGHAEPGRVYGMIVRLPKTESDSGFEVRVIEPKEQADLFQAFLNAKSLWEFKQKYNKWLAGSAEEASA